MCCVADAPIYTAVEADADCLSVGTVDPPPCVSNDLGFGTVGVFVVGSTGVINMDMAINGNRCHQESMKTGEVSCVEFSKLCFYVTHAKHKLKQTVQ